MFSRSHQYLPSSSSSFNHQSRNILFITYLRLSILSKQQHQQHYYPQKNQYFNTYQKHNNNNLKKNSFKSSFLFIPILVLSSLITLPFSTSTTTSSSSSSSENNTDNNDQSNNDEENDVSTAVSHLSVHAKRGPRATMEDRWFVSDDLRYFGVFDGHGGPRVAEQAMINMYPLFNTKLKQERGNKRKDNNPDNDNLEIICEAMKSSFNTVSDLVLNNNEMNMEGSTAVVVYISSDNYVTGNLGDSRAILCRGSQAINLSIDHKPDSPKERERIEKLGGVVKWHGYLGPDRLPVVGMGAYRINGNLAVSRALGDKPERPFVSSEVEIITTPRKPGEDRFIILASDGVWDVLSSQDAVDFVRQIMSGSVGNRRANSRVGGGGNQVKVISRQGNSGGGGGAAISSTTLEGGGGGSSSLLLGGGGVSNTIIGSSGGNSINGNNKITSSPTQGIRAEMDTRKEKMAHYLVEEALRRGSADNVTAIVVWLR
jgi:serine/threonine protein phosphatase PrpC